MKFKLKHKTQFYIKNIFFLLILNSANPMPPQTTQATLKSIYVYIFNDFKIQIHPILLLINIDNTTVTSLCLVNDYQYVKIEQKRTGR